MFTDNIGDYRIAAVHKAYTPNAPLGLTLK